ncbi:MAG: hypothetical protein ABW321_13865 [Polyangiales bacterium]
MIRAFVRDERGAAIVETMVSFPVLLFTYLGLYMFIYILAGHLMVQRAADAGARAAVVFLPDPDGYYGGSYPSKQQYIELAVRAALMPSPYMRFDSIVLPAPPGEFNPLRAEVHAHFDCGPFLASFMCGTDRKVDMQAAVTFPYQQGFADRK